MAILATAACGDPLTGTWTATDVGIANGHADLSLHFNQDDSFAFAAVARHAAHAHELPGCQVTISMVGFRWSESPSGRQITITPASNARTTFEVAACSDPTENVASSVTVHPTDPPATLEYAITDLGLFVTGALAGWQFHPIQIPRHSEP